MHADRHLLRGLAIALTATFWSWPLAVPHPIVKPYLAPATPYTSGHRGIDISAAAGAGAQVIAPDGGVVRFAGFVVDRPVLSIDHGGGVISSYEPVESELVVGDIVRRGDVVGALLTGHCTSTCLHLGVRVDGQYVSPLLFLGGQPRAVLLPLRASDPDPENVLLNEFCFARGCARMSGWM